MGFQTPTENIRTARRCLASARDALDLEIQTYPRPISGCDAQYNHLLAERRRIHEALAALEAEVHIPTPRAP
ncbi:MAG TPA: hypothetical protein VLA52_08950 [Thermohalobaculum sp.]|nr:hypothetical protein [Thermohalobaculum sp.]